MAEFKMPKFVYKDKPISLDKCYQELADMSYKSPIDVIYQGFQTKLEGDIFEAIYSYGVDVDKDELVKALKYDRDQYRKGFEDGSRLRTDTIKAEVAWEIFADIDRVVEKYSMGDIEYPAFVDIIAELKNKYTEEQE